MKQGAEIPGDGQRDRSASVRGGFRLSCAVMKWVLAWLLVAILILLPARLRGAESSGDTAKPPTKTYRNPLLPDVVMADPHVIRVDSKYYLYATTHTRGYDVFVSSDLVNWTNKGLAFDDPRRGAWAPDVFHNRR